ncbi:putative amidoligase domain-containing protein [Desmospora activa]|uniref:PhiEco32-like amidoligase-type 2 protein n=1 Tax=Desmospora activa DSM 45169 TaxID=1121389 RepID=A0A2T4ZAJ9_9BACL|nr:hypothetical protein [Desmospora activa]PTM58895.1 phiEco32-like amidoligase-type 2 protein [Desmospora activa DSM 45169]
MKPLLLECGRDDVETRLLGTATTSRNHLASSIHLRWNGDPLYVSSMLGLNHTQQVESAQSSEWKKEIWKLHGLTVAASQATVLRLYVVPVFQTQALLLYRSKTSPVWLSGGGGKPTFQRVSTEDQSREVRKVKAMAIRAFYSLGLDYGVAKIGIQPGNQIVVVDVAPGPRINREMGVQLAEAVQLYIKRLPRLWASLDQVMLGADPEFIMQKSNGTLVMASDYFPRYGSVGCDAIWHGQNRSIKPLVELRPKPNKDPRQLVLRMYKDMMTASRRVNNKQVEWLAGALPHPKYPLGGHIHFSGILLTFQLLRALDLYLALPLMLAEDGNGVQRRPRYGFLGDYRLQFHGGFEYRTLPSWLISPTLTKGSLAAAKLIAARYPHLPLDDWYDRKLQQAYYRGEKKKVRERVKVLWESLRSLKEYAWYEKDLDRFYQMIVSGITWNEKEDIRKRWKLPPYQK